MNRPGPLPRIALLLLLLAWLPAACSRRDPAQEQRQRAALERQRQAAERCERDRRALPPLLEALERTDRRLSAVEAESYVPSAPPEPLDPEEQRRLAIYDQEIEQERYDEAYAAWQERERPRRAAWRRDQQQRLEAAQQERREALLQIQRAYPALVSETPSLRLRPESRDRLLACGTRPPA